MHVRSTFVASHVEHINTHQGDRSTLAQMLNYKVLCSDRLNEP